MEIAVFDENPCYLFSSSAPPPARRRFHRLNLSPAPCFINSAMNILNIESLEQRPHVANCQCLI